MNLRAQLTPKAEKEMEEKWVLEREAVELLGAVVSEWSSDPLSVQCFDLRMVKRAKEVVTRLGKLSIW